MVVQADRLTEIAEDATAALRARLSAKVALYEARYEFPSSDLRSALASGRVKDTLDICDWLIAWEALDALGRGGGPARLE